MNMDLPFNRSIIALMVPGMLLSGCHPASEKTTTVKHTVEIREMRFQPAELAIRAGDTVEWINNDLVDHDVTKEENKEWSSGVLKNGQSWKTVIKKTTGYYCSLHVVMKGKLIVK